MLLKHLWCTLMVALFFLPAKAQVNIDSLKGVWNNPSGSNENRLKAVQEIAFGHFLSHNPDSASYYADLQYDLARSIDDKRSMALSLRTNGTSKIYRGKYDEAIEAFELSLNISKEIGDQELMGFAISNMGSAYQKKGDLDKALEKYLAASKMMEEMGNIGKNGMILQYIGIIYFQKGDLDEALDYLNRSNKIFEELKDNLSQASTQNTIASLYKQQGDLEQALDIYTKNLKIYKENNFERGIAGTLTNMASIYRQNGDLEKAIENDLLALKIFERLGNTYGISGVSSNIANAYLEQRNFPLAIEYMNRSITISEDTGNKEGLTHALTSKAGIYIEQKDYPNAIAAASKGLVLAQDMGNLLSIDANSFILAQAYRSVGSYKKALEMTDIYLQAKDSLNSEENQKAIIKLQVQSDYDRQKAIDDLENEKQVAIETQKTQAQKKLSVAIGIGLLLSSFLALGVFNRLKVTRKQKEIIEAQKIKVEQSEKYKEQFLANMSHEIRTPMHAISGMVKILDRNPHPATQDAYLKAMETSADNLVVILNDVLDLSKIEAGKLDIERIPVSPMAVMQNVTQILKYKAEEKGLELAYEVANDVPHLVMGDPTRLNQILLNLTGNAIKFTEKGSVEIQLKVQENKLQFSVKDTGIGISQEKQKSIFGAFEQANRSTSRYYGGTGLGLSISKQLVELQKGRIWVESEEGKGSVFYVELPLISASEDAIGQDIISKEKLQKMADSLAGIRILLAEDNPFNQMIAQDDLSFYIKDVTIETVENGAMAVEKFRSGAYDLILMDVQMPKMNGFEATEKIREIEKSEGGNKAISIIAMTASLLNTEISSCYASGMNNYIPKPYKLEELIAPIYKELQS